MVATGAQQKKGNKLHQEGFIKERLSPYSLRMCWEAGWPDPPPPPSDTSAGQNLQSCTESKLFAPAGTTQAHITTTLVDTYRKLIQILSSWLWQPNSERCSDTLSPVPPSPLSLLTEHFDWWVSAHTSGGANQLAQLVPPQTCLDCFVSALSEKSSLSEKSWRHSGPFQVIRLCPPTHSYLRPPHTGLRT